MFGIVINPEKMRLLHSVQISFTSPRASGKGIPDLAILIREHKLHSEPEIKTSTITLTVLPAFKQLAFNFMANLAESTLSIIYRLGTEINLLHLFD